LSETNDLQAQQGGFMDKLVQSLGPVFAAGLAVQQLFELLDPLLAKYAGDNKKLWAGGLSLVTGLFLAFGVGLRTLQPLGISEAGFFDPLVTGLIISGGTEGLNSILKFLKYSKEDKKTEAAAKKPGGAAPAPGVAFPHLIATQAQLSAMDRK
jgi:hypothetical protein